MQRPAPPAVRPKGAAPLLVALLALAGCSSVPRSEPFPDHLHFELPYLRSQPHDRLVVEIDAVEGCEPDDAALGALRDMLGACDKPRGVELLPVETIPRATVAGMHHRRIALDHLQGPPRKDGSVAFLYVLLFDSGADEELRLGRAALVEWSHPAAIYVDLSEVREALARTPRLAPRDLLPSVLAHEAGHVLGLVRSSREGDATSHCDVEGCLMSPTIPVSFTSALATGRFATRTLCARCREHLARSKTSPGRGDFASLGDEAFFVGPALVRRAKGYFVITLPGATFVHLRDSPPDERLIGPVRELAAREHATLTRRGWCTGYLADTSTPEKRAALRPVLEAALADPDRHARQGAKRLADGPR